MNFEFCSVHFLEVDFFSKALETSRLKSTSLERLTSRWIHVPDVRHRLSSSLNDAEPCRGKEDEIIVPIFSTVDIVVRVSDFFAARRYNRER